ncbi:MAG: hypothetical protein WC415_02335 [Patescibacteria group bacterium]|jgi:hypothetical protein
MTIFDLFSRIPKPGAGFNFSDPDDGLEVRLKALVLRSPNFQNLQNNIKVILDVLREYGHYLRSGGLSFWQKRTILEKIKKTDHTLTEEDIKDVKKILNKLGRE